MASCITNLTSLISSGQIAFVPTITNDTVTAFTGLNSTTNILFRFNSSQVQTITINTNIIAETTQPFTIYSSIFYLAEDGTTLINKGTSVLMDQVQTFQIEITAGDFFVCLSVQRGAYHGTIKIHYIGYDIYTKLSTNAYVGSTMSIGKIDNTPKEVKCRYPIYYEIVEGELPIGLTLGSDGNIVGTIPEMDCLDSNIGLPPSVNWFFENKVTGQWEAWGRPYSFKVRVWVGEFPTVEAFRWFSIRIYNNWSLDRDLFMSLVPMEGVMGRINETREEFRLPDTLCPPCVDIEKEHSEEGLCEPCPSPLQVELITDLCEPCDKIVFDPMDDEEIRNLKVLKANEARLAQLLKELEDRLSVNGRNPTDMDQLYLNLKDKINDVLPMEVMFRFGSSMSCTLMNGSLYD